MLEDRELGLLLICLGAAGLSWVTALMVMVVGFWYISTSD